MCGIDTIKFVIPTDEVVKGDRGLKKLVNDLNLSPSHFNDRVYYNGWCNNIKISVGNYQTSLSGSLPKFFNGHQGQWLNQKEIFEAIELLSYKTKIDVWKSSIGRIDLGGNLYTNFSPNTYYKTLGFSRYYPDRLEQTDSVRWQSIKRVKTVYDKIKQLKSKNQDIPKILSNKHVLRFEYRILKDTSNLLRLENNSILNLIDKDNLINLSNLWLKEWATIEKQNIYNFNPMNIKNPTDYNNYLLQVAIDTIGLNCINEQVKLLSRTKTLTRPEYSSRIKRKLKELNKGKNSEVSPLVDELNKKVAISQREYIDLL